MDSPKPDAPAATLDQRINMRKVRALLDDFTDAVYLVGYEDGVEDRPKRPPKWAVPAGAQESSKASPRAWLVTRRFRKDDVRRATYFFHDRASAVREYEGWLDHPEADPELLPLYAAVHQQTSEPDQQDQSAPVRAQEKSS